MSEDEADVRRVILSTVKDILINPNALAIFKDIAGLEEITSENFSDLNEALKENRGLDVMIKAANSKLMQVTAGNEEVLITQKDIDALRKEVAAPRSITERVMRIFTGERTLDDKMNDLLGFDLNAATLSKAKEGKKLLSPLGTLAISGAA
jgi:hypothetical protein